MAMGKRHVERRAQTHEHGAGHRLHGTRRLALGKGWKNSYEGRSGLETCEGATALDDFVAGRKPDLRPSTHAEQVWHLSYVRRYALRALDDLSRHDEDEVRHRYSYSGDGEPQELMAIQAGTTTVPALLGGVGYRSSASINGWSLRSVSPRMTSSSKCEEPISWQST